MQRLGWLGVLLAAPALFAAAPPAQDGVARRLIGLLGSDDGAERERAAEGLEARGALALPALRTALRHRDPEVRAAARRLLRVIERKVDGERALRPTMVRLTCKNAPVGEVVAELARQSGFAIQLKGGKGKRITLDTRKTFWEALARLEAIGGLRLDDPTTRHPVGRRVEGEFRRRHIAYLDSTALGPARFYDGPLVLEPSKAPALPTCHAGALRIQALSARARPGSREVTVTLRVQPEPRLAWQSAAMLRIERAIDDRGQTLTPRGAFVGKRADTEAEYCFLISNGSHHPLPRNLGLRHLPVKLALAKKPSRRLRELRGTLSGWVSGEPEVLATVAPVLGRKGGKVTARGGATLAISARRTDTRCILTVEVIAPPLKADLLPARLRLVNLTTIRGGASCGTALTPADCPFILADARNRAFPLAEAHFEYGDRLTSKRYTLNYRLVRDRGAPARLLYWERRSVQVQVPFVLKDVPLPAGGKR
jgi:hypothetical protein